MRFLKASLIFLSFLLLQAAALYYIADLLPQPFYAVPFIFLIPGISLLAAAFYLGYCDKNILLLQLPALLLLLLPFMLACFILWPEYANTKGCLLYCGILLLALFLSGFSARTIYLQKSMKNEE